MSVENQHINFETFRKYFSGAMSAAEKSVFEKNLENDPFVQDAYKGFLILETDAARVSALDSTNSKFKEKVGLGKNDNVFPIKTLVGIAASVVLLVGSIYLFQNNFKEKNAIAENVVVEPEIIEEEIVEMPIDSEGIYFNDTNQTIVSGTEDFEDLQVPIESQNIIVEQEAVKEKKSAPQSSKPSKDVVVLDNIKQDNKAAESKAITHASDKTTATYNSLPIQTEKESGNNLEMISDYQSGIVYYNQSKYDDAIKVFNTSIANKKNVSSSNYYIGMSYFNLGKTNNAINYFDKVIGTDSSFADDAQYFKAITLIGKGQKEKAKVILNELINSNSSFKKAAQNKLNSL